MRKPLKALGFSLIELLVVVAMIAVLAAILFPVLISAKLTAKRTVCQSNMKQLTLATSIYLQDSDGRYPAQPEDGVPDWKESSAKPNWARSLERYVKSAHIPACPCSTKRYDCRTNCTMTVDSVSYPISYFGNGQIFKDGITEGSVSKPSRTILFQCCGKTWNKCWLAPTWNDEYSQWCSYVSRSWCGHNEGTNLAFIDGHIKWIDYQALATNLRLFEPFK